MPTWACFTFIRQSLLNLRRLLNIEQWTQQYRVNLEWCIIAFNLDNCHTKNFYSIFQLNCIPTLYHSHVRSISVKWQLFNHIYTKHSLYKVGYNNVNPSTISNVVKLRLLLKLSVNTFGDDKNVLCFRSLLPINQYEYI